MSYATLDQLKEYLGIAIMELSEDDLLQRLLDAASAKIDSELRMTFAVTSDTTRYFDDSESIHGDTLRLDAYLLSVTSIVNGDGTAIPVLDVVGVPRNEPRFLSLRIKASSSKYWYIDDDISITGKWGYSEQAPADIVQACVRLAAYVYRQKDNSGDLDRAVVAVGGTMLPAALPKDVDQFLRPYRGVSL